MAKSPFSFKILSLLFWREKKSKSKFWGDGIFLDLVDFQSTGSWDFSSLFFDKRPLNVGRHVEHVSLRKE